MSTFGSWILSICCTNSKLCNCEFEKRYFIYVMVKENTELTQLHCTQFNSEFVFQRVCDVTFQLLKEKIDCKWHADALHFEEYSIIGDKKNIIFQLTLTQISTCYRQILIICGTNSKLIVNVKKKAFYLSINKQMCCENILSKLTI